MPDKVEQLAAQALEEIRMMAEFARRSIGQRLRHIRQQSSDEFEFLRQYYLGIEK
jgi:hypothetical protein